MGTAYGPMDDLSKTLREWNGQKSQTLMKLFGGNDLILRRPFTYAISKDGLRKEFDTARYKHPIYMQILTSWMWDLQKNPYYQQNYETFLYDIISRETLIENAYLGDSFIFTFEDGEAYKISKGMKPMKIFHKLFEKTCPEFLTIPEGKYTSFYEDFRNWHSRIFNQAHTDGELCLSIHPLDFMTMSDNDNGWESCMTWTRDTPGDYRAGTLECMNSPYIICAYLHNPNHKMTEGDWEWNSKRWRELFIVNEYVISEIKAYPYQDENLTNAALMWIKELATTNLGWEYDNEEINYNDSFKISDERTICIKFEPTYYMYNDFGTLDIHRMRVNKTAINNMLEEHSNYYDKIQWYEQLDYSKNDESWIIFIEFPYGGDATCVWCGDYLDADEEKSNMVMCAHCAPIYRCGCCGEYINENDIYWIDDYDDPICRYCYENNTSVDPLTDELHMSDDSNWTRIYLGVENGNDVALSNKYVEIYEPDYNCGYDTVFDGAPKSKSFGYSWNIKYYITKDMIKDMDKFLDLFEWDEENFMDELSNLALLVTKVETSNQDEESQ